MLVNICMIFHDDILNDFKVTEQTRFCLTKFKGAYKLKKKYINKSYGSCILHVI